MKKLSLSLLVLVSATSLVADQVINIANNTNQPLGLNLTVPEYTAAVIQFTKIKSAQEMLHQAILDNSAEGIKKAIAAGANVNLEKEGKLPILWALLLNKLDALEELLVCGANPNQTLIQSAIKMRNMKAILLFIKKGLVSLSSDELSSLLTYSKEDVMLQIINELLSQGYDANKLWTVLMHFMHKFSSKDCEILINCIIKKGANPDQVILRGKGIAVTPLFLAIEWRNNEATRVLLAIGANPNQKANPKGAMQTPLSCAVDCGTNPRIIELLLAHGATL